MNAAIRTGEAGGRPRAVGDELDILVAPQTAFATCRDWAPWSFVLLATVVMAVIGAVLVAPASAHVVTLLYQQLFATDPEFMSTPAQQRAETFAAIKVNVYFNALFPLLIVPLSALVGTGLLLVGAGLRKARFRPAFSLVVHVAFVWLGLGALCAGIITALRGPEAYRTMLDLYTSLPSAAWLIPAAPAKVAVALSQLNVFSVWGAVLLAQGATVALGMRRVAAIATALVILLLPLAFGLANGR